MEIVVAMAVLTALAMAAGSMLIGSLNTTSQDRQRVRAANVAAAEIELVRGQMQTNPAAIALDLVKDETVSGTTYHVVRNGTWQATDSFSALNLTVTVTWPGMKGVKPVVNSSVLTALGAGGDGSGGTVVAVSAAPGVTADPLISVSPTCSINLGTALVTVTTETVEAGLTVVTPLLSGEVVVTPTGSNVCEARTLSVASGVALATLPYGEWNFSATTSAGSAFATATLDSTLQLPVSLNIVDTSSCANSAPVTVNVTTNLQGVVGVLETGTVVATRAATADCPELVQYLDVVAGVALGALSYGNWTLSAGSGGTTATASTTIGSPSQVTVNLDIDDDFVPLCSSSSLVTLNVKTKQLLGGLLSDLPSGTVTATRAPTTGCAGDTYTFDVLGGLATGTLSYGDWTFTATTSTGGATITVGIDDAVETVPITIDDSCSGSALVTTVVQDQNPPLLPLTYSITATRTADACGGATVVSTTALLGVSVGLDLTPGEWTFSVTGKTVVSPKLVISTSPVVDYALVVQ